MRNLKSPDRAGLDITLSSKIAEALGGDMELIQTQDGVRSIFGIEFLDYKRIRSKAVKAKKGVDYSLESKSILIVDDSEDNLEIIKLFLNSYGGDVDVANSGSEALLMMKNRNYDIVLMDIEMPKMNGFQVIKEIRNLKFKTPIIAITAHAMPEDRQKTKSAGFFDHVTKPIDFNCLVSSIVKT